MIIIKLNKSDKCNGEYSLYISFPYNQNIVNVMREQTIRYWHPDTKEWEIPAKNFDSLKKQLKDYEIHLANFNENQFKQLFNDKVINYIPQDYKFKIRKVYEI